MKNVPKISDRLIRDKFTKYEGLQELIFLNEKHSNTNECINILLRYDQQLSGLNVYCTMNNQPIILVYIFIMILYRVKLHFKSHYYLNQDLLHYHLRSF